MHKPKPVHNGREFLVEIGAIVIGLARLRAGGSAPGGLSDLERERVFTYFPRLKERIAQAVRKAPKV